MRILHVLALFAASPVMAQPYSQSMAECAGIYAFGRTWVKQDDASYLLEYGQAKWLNAAIVQAQAEGIADPANYAHNIMDAKEAEWNGRGLSIAFSEDFYDWWDYCRAFGRAQGIALKPA